MTHDRRCLVRQMLVRPRNPDRKRHLPITIALLQDHYCNASLALSASCERPGRQTRTDLTVHEVFVKNAHKITCGVLLFVVCVLGGTVPVGNVERLKTQSLFPDKPTRNLPLKYEAVE